MTTAAPTPSLFGQYLAKFFGTVLLIFFGTGYVAALRIAGANLGLWEISIIWEVGVSIAIYLSTGVPGVRLNPAVSIALQLFAGFEGRKLPFYITIQVTGAFCAAALVYTLYSSLFIEFERVQDIVRGNQGSPALTSVFSTYPHPALSVSQAFLVEVVITAILMVAVMALTGNGNDLPHGPSAPLLIGLLIVVIGNATGPLAGFTMNPTHDFGPKLMIYLANWGPIAFIDGREIPCFLMPIFAPILGTCLGAGGYRALIARHLPSVAAPTEAGPEKVRAS